MLQRLPKNILEMSKHLDGLVGARVCIVEGGAAFKGRVMNQNTKLGRLGVYLDQGEQQNFFESEITSITVLESRDVGWNNGSILSNAEGNKIISSEEDMKRVFDSLRPECSNLSEVPGRMGTPGGRNCHLLNLASVNMAQLLGGEEDMEALPRCQDRKGMEYRLLPAVISSSKPRTDANGHTLPRSFCQALIRERVWADQDTPPQILTPSRLYMIHKMGDMFEEAVARVLEAKLVGLGGEGGLLGRAMPLPWLLITTRDDVFMFDVQALGDEGWRYGLRTVLQDPQVTKVTHDCRPLSDCLWHQHGVKLEGVWDTMAGDLVIHADWVHRGFLSRYTRSLAHLVIDYLGVRDDHFSFPRYRRARLAVDQAGWVQRPLSPHLELEAARGVLYLPSLYSVVRAATMQPFHRAVAILNTHVRDKDDPDAASLAFETHLIPGRLRGVMPSWERDQPARKLQEKGFLVEGDFVHNNVGNPDPVLVFSRDSMHLAAPLSSIVEK